MPKATTRTTIEEPSRRTAVREKVDVLVCGGGLGGIAAATAAARAGARTLLLERNAFLGGTATAGQCCSIFNCYFTGGEARQLATTGIAVEVADRLAEATGYGQRWRQHKGHIIYDLEQAKLALQELVEAAGARVLLNTWTSGAWVENGRVSGVVFEGKGGREAVLADAVVDATGDSDVAVSAGASVRVMERALHSVCFRLGNVDVNAFVGYFREHPDQFPAHMDVDWTVDEALAQYEDCGTFLFPHGGGMQLAPLQAARESGALPESVGTQDTLDACQMHALQSSGIVHVITGFTRFNGLDLEQTTRSLTDGRKMAGVVAHAFREYVPGFERATVIDTATNLGVRASRFVDGAFSFTADMMQAGARQPDAVGRAVGWDGVVKHPGAGAWSAQVCRQDSFDLPLRCLLPKGVEGLLMGAGRSVSADNPYLLRVMAHTMVVGQAAGTAAAVAARTERPPAAVDLGEVQAELCRQGVTLD